MVNSSLALDSACNNTLNDVFLAGHVQDDDGDDGDDDAGHHGSQLHAATAILETMWVWNDYLLPTLVLDIKKYRTIPMAIQYFRGGYGRVELAPMMACIIIAIIPIIILYMTCQKYIIEGVVAGAVKG